MFSGYRSRVVADLKKHAGALRRAAHHHGFSLIELVIAMAIVGILTAMVVPSYTDYLRRSQVQEAVATLAELHVRLEQHYQDHLTYAAPAPAAASGSSPQGTTGSSTAGSSTAGSGISGAGATVDPAASTTALTPPHAPTCGVRMPALPNQRFTYACVLADDDGQAYTVTATGSGLSRGLVYSFDQTGARRTTCTQCAWAFVGPVAGWQTSRP